MARDYFRSGYGCGDYVVTHPKCRFGLKRVNQVMATLISEIVTVMSVYLHPVATVLAVVAILGTLDAITIARRNTVASLSYPIITALLGTAFSSGFLYRFLRRGWRPPITSSVRLERRLKSNETVGQTAPLSVIPLAVEVSKASTKK